MANRLILILLLVTIRFLATAQYTHPPYKQYTMRDGLPQMQVWSMFQDSRGYLWIGTKGGLSRFNGENFTNFTEKDGLTDNLINFICEDYSGKIWIITQRGISTIDGSTIASFPYPHQNLQLAPTPDGKIWYLGTAPNTIFGYFENGKNHSLIEKFPELVDNTSFVAIAYSDKNKTLILSTGHKVFEFKDGEMKQAKVVSGEMRIKKKGSEILLYEWDEYNNINIYEYLHGEIVLVARINNGKLFGENRCNFHHELMNGNIRSQLFILKPGTFEVKDFPGNYINASLFDRDENLWVGTEEGLCQVFSGGFETYKREFFPMIWSIVEDKQQNIWFASYNFGLMKFDGTSITNYSAESLQKYGSFFYFQSQVDKRGVLYFPNNFGIVYYDGKSFGSIKDRVWASTFYDEQLELLFAGRFEQVKVYNLDHKIVRLLDGPKELKMKGAVSAFGKDRNENIWMGNGSGLTKYRWETGEITHYDNESGKLPSTGVVSIYTDPYGRTWFGGTQGLLWYNEKKDSVCKIESEEILEIVNLVSSIDSTWLVFSQPTGIYLMDLKKFNHEGKLEFTLFNQRNGFIGLEPGQNGAMKDSKGNIWMTTGTEVVKLNPKALEFNKNSVNVRISAFNGNPLPFTQNQIKLPRNERTAIVQFETICFNQPKSAEYSWKINDKEWTSWQKENYAVLTELSDGKLNLEVKTKIPGLPYSQALSSMELIVSVALWKQAWFFPTLLVFVSLLVLLTIVLLIQSRIQMVQINKQAKTFQLQAILSQMNPHFIFNVMASLQSMILSANIEKANDYLVRMSNLVRGFLEASVSTSSSRSKRLQNGELPLRKELEILQTFIEFQQLIYPEKFESRLVIDPQIDPDKISIPPMLIQPFVENAIRHGLLQKERDGLLQIKIDMEEKNQLSIVISDNGIGIQKAGEIIGKSPLLYTSRGKELTEKRIKLLNEMGYLIIYQTTSSDQGTTVTLKIGKHES
jgi:ligand-binding sensor domain-containing protein